MRVFAGPALLWLLSLPLVLACTHTPPPAPALEATGAASVNQPAVFVEQRGAPPPGVAELGPSCPPEVGLAPSAFFGDQLLVRLPPELEAEQVPQRSPNFARSHSPLTMGCEPGLSAAIFLERETALDAEGLDATRARLFRSLNFPERLEILTLAGSDETDDISMSIGFPEHPVWGGTRVYLRMIERYGQVLAIGFITDLRSYHRLEPVFAASARTMVALPS
jgi:hypothetical protein